MPDILGRELIKGGWSRCSSGNGPFCWRPNFGSECTGAQPTLVVTFTERHASRAQDVVCGDGVEMEVWQGERKNEGLRRESKPSRADLEV
jgi:hypothetical protein